MRRMNAVITCNRWTQSLFLAVLPLAVLIPTVLFPEMASAAEVKSITAGNWSSGATWSSGVAPSASDTVTVGHQVTLDVSHSHTGGTLELAPGASLLLAKSATLSILSNARFTALCLTTPGSLCEIRSISPNPADYGNIVFGGKEFTAQFVQFDKVGNSATHAIDILVPDTTNPPGRTPQGDFSLTISNSKFIGGGAVRFGNFLEIGGLPSNGSVALLYTTFENTLAPYSLFVSSLAPKGDGLRTIAASSFDKSAVLFPAREFTIEDNYFHDAYEVLSSSAVEGWKSFNGNLVRYMGNNELPIAGDSRNNYWLADVPSRINPHFVQVPDVMSVTINGDIFEFTGANSEGDCILMKSPSSPQTVTIKHSIVLPNAGLESSGTLFSALGNSNTTIVAEHNTYFTGSQGAVVGESYFGHVGLVSSFRSNLAWDNVGNARGFVLGGSLGASPVTDIVPAAAITNNAGINLLTSYKNLKFSSGTPGENDLNQNPNFIDPWRNLASWDASLGGPGTVANALSKVRSVHEWSGNDSRYAIAALRKYIREGFYPQSTAFRTAAHDGTTIGAVQSNAGEVPVAPPEVVVVPTSTPTIAPTSPTGPISPGSVPTPTGTPCVAAALLPPGVPPCTILLPPIVITPTAENRTRTLKRACRKRSNVKRQCVFTTTNLTCRCSRRRAVQRR